jgi:hypothetical protein
MNNQSNSISTKYSPIKLAHFNKKCKFIGSVLNDLIEQLFSNKDVTEILKSLSNKICNVLNDNFSSEDFAIVAPVPAKVQASGAEHYLMRDLWCGGLFCGENIHEYNPR